MITALLIAIGGIFAYLESRNTSPTHIKPLPPGFNQHGIDVSHHQGKINWNAFLPKMDSTISFIYCKATEGTHFTDPQWKRNDEFLGNSRIRHGAYHFYLPNKDSKRQAERFVKTISVSKGSLPPVLDSETEAPTAQLVNGMKTWLTTVEQSIGIRPIIYTSYHLYSTKLKGKFPGYKFWIASYNPDQRRVTDPEVILWQYSDHGRMPGIVGDVDLNFGKPSL